LKEVAGRIAADEFRHYRLFYEILVKESEPDLPIWRKLWVAATRLGESEDDELACAYYCANVPADLADTTPYERKVYALAYTRAVMTLYQRHHIEKLVKMVVKPAGLNPAGRVTQLASAALWKVMSYRGRAQDERAKAA
jgi:hypothetical protein